AYYLRLTALDRSGVMASIAGILGEEGISIEAIQQKEPAPGETHVPLIMLTHRVREADMNRALARIKALEAVQGEAVRIRMEMLAG
ncbi:MAG: ACT domain-containing protein, partial [Thiohalocapsa sp.]